MTLVLQRITADYGRTTRALSDVSLTIAAGELTAILGPSGSGKTTLLRVIAGLHRPAAGTILLDGADITRRPPERRRIGLVPQDGALFGHMTVAANVGYGLRGARGRRAARRHPRVRELLALVELGQVADRLPHRLSGGQQQRVALARALAPQPRLLLMDEPFSALDASLRDQLRHDVAVLLRELGITSVLITHDQAEALSMADHVVVMREGGVVQTGSAQEIYRRPADRWVATFVGDANLLPILGPPAGRTAVPTILGPIEVGPGAPGRGVVMLRPEQIALTASPAAAAPGARGVVRAVRHFGHDRLVQVAIGPDMTPITVRTPALTPLAVGERVGLMAIDRGHLIPPPPAPAAGG